MIGLLGIFACSLAIFIVEYAAVCLIIVGKHKGLPVFKGIKAYKALQQAKD